MTKDLEVISSFSDATYSSPSKGAILEMVAKGPGMTIGPDSTSVMASDSMKEAGFIVTPGSSALSNSRGGTPCVQYMWDEPWSGDNAPKRLVGSKIDEEDSNSVNREHTMVRNSGTKTATRISMIPHRANTIRVSTSTTIIRSPSRTGIAAAIAEQAGIGVLPDAASSKESVRPEGPEDDDDMFLPIQGTPVSDDHPRKVQSSQPLIDHRLSWLQFDLDSPTELERPQTSGATPGWKRVSWLDDRSHEDLNEQREQGPQDKKVNIEVRERGVRTLDMEKRGEELGWDLESNRSEMRDNW